MTTIQWYPGHIAKAKRKLLEFLKLTDIVIYVLDSRLPFGTRLTEIEDRLRQKKIILLLNKSDLSDPKKNQLWINYFSKKYPKVFLFEALDNKGIKEIFKSISFIRNQIVKNSITKDIRLMVVGVPNCGKSSLINRLSCRKATKVGALAGVTRSHQWIMLENGIYILDQPGIFFPKIDSHDQAWKLAVIGSIKLEVLPIEEIALKLVDYLMKHDYIKSDDPLNFITDNAKKSGFFVGNENAPDIIKSSLNIIKRFQDGKFGRITLEEPVI